MSALLQSQKLIGVIAISPKDIYFESIYLSSGVKSTGKYWMESYIFSYDGNDTKEQSEKQRTKIPQIGIPSHPTNSLIFELFLEKNIGNKQHAQHTVR